MFQTVALLALDVLIATTKSSSVYNLQIAVMPMENVYVRLALEETTAQSRSADLWQTAKTDHRGKKTNANAETAGRVSIATFALPTMPAMQ